MERVKTWSSSESGETVRRSVAGLHTGPMRVAVLGPLQVDGVTVAWGRRDRVVLESIALRPVVGVSVDGLSEAIWGDQVPSSAAKIVQGCVMRLRRALGPAAVERNGSGYRLMLHRDEADHLHFEDLVTRGRSMLESGQPDRSLYLLDEAMRLWRGEPFADLADWGPARIEVERLGELLRDAEELRCAALLDYGQVHEALALLTGLVNEEPTREERWRLLATAQYRVGRQADALATLRHARAVLADELGLDPGPALVEAEKLILRQAPELDRPAAPPTVSDECPYPGLLPYEMADAAAFFGREEDVAVSLRRLDAEGVLAVVGPSGSGKSSLLRAGVAAALSHDGHDVTVTTPAQWLASRRRLPISRGDTLVLDQFEELLTLPSQSAIEFLAMLVEARSGSSLVAIGLRADRLADLSAYPEVATIVEDGMHLLRPMTGAGLRQAIEGPANQAGLRLEDGLVELLQHEVEGAPGALPLLSHVLRETWELREGRTLTLNGYRATGGVRRAVSQSAENVFRELTTTEQDMLRDLMTRLVEPGEEGAHVRRRVARRVALRDDVRVRLVERLVEARLLISDDQSVQIAHEALVDAWPRLRTWLDDDVEGLRIKRHVSVAADSWEELGRPESELYRGVRQARAAAWQDRADPELTDTERDFLSASGDLARRETAAAEEQLRSQRRANQRLRLVLAGVAALLATSIVAGTFALSASHRAEDQALSADARAMGAEALRADGIDQELLFAAAGMTLKNTADTRTNLVSLLGQAGPLIGTARDVPSHGLAVSPETGVVTATSISGGLSVRDGTTLRPLKRDLSMTGGAIVASVGRGLLVTETIRDLVGDGPGRHPAVVLLDGSGAVADRQLGGLPKGRYVQHDLSVSPDGRWLAATFRDRSGREKSVVGVWDLDARERPRAMVDLGSQPFHPIVAGNGRTLYSIGEGRLRVTDLASGRARMVLTPADLGVREIGEAIALSPDSQLLAVSAAPELVIVDTRTLRPRHFLNAPLVFDLEFASQGMRLAGAGGPALIVWDLSADEPTELLSQDDGGFTVAFSGDGGTVYSDDPGGLLRAWDLRGRGVFLTHGPLPAIQANPGGATVRLSPSGDRVLLLQLLPKPTFYVRETSTGGVISHGEVHQPVTNWSDAAWSPDGLAFNVALGDPTVALWEAATGRLVRHISLPDGEASSFTAFTPDGRYLLVGTTAGRLHVLDARTLDAVRAPIQASRASSENEARAVSNVAASADGRTALVNFVGQPSRLVDYLAGQIRDLGVDFDTQAGGFSPDAQRLFLSGQDGSVGLLDVASRTWIAPPSNAHPFGSWTVAFSPDGGEVTSAGARWDGRSGTFLGAVPDFPVSVYAADGRRIIGSSIYGQVLTWDLDPSSWVAAACRMAGRDLTAEEWHSILPDRPARKVCPT